MGRGLDRRNANAYGKAMPGWRSGAILHHDSICMRSRSATRPACAYEPHRMARTPFPIFSDGVARHDRDHYKVTLLSSDEIPGSFKGKNPTKESVWGLA